MSTKVTLGNPSQPLHGVGNVNTAMIRTRAVELAISDGRTEAEVDEHDYEMARKELAPSENSPSQNLNAGTEYTDQSIGEALIKGGLDEAQHDIALAAEIDRVG